MMSKLRSVSRVSLLCAALLLAAACGSADSLVPNAPASTQDPPAVAPAASVTIRLSGAGAQVYRTFNVTIDQIDVRVDGSPTEVVPGARMVDVASGTEAVLARFPLPQPGSTVRVSLKLAASGAWVDSTGSGPIDSRGLPITVEAPAELIRSRALVEVRLDMASSLLPAEGSLRVLLPGLAVFF